MGSMQSISIEELNDVSRQCAALHEDWQRLYALASAPDATGAGPSSLAFIQLQGRFSCDYPILTHWRKANFGLASGIGKLVAHAGTLEALSREVKLGDGPLVREWHEVNTAIGKVRALLETARQQAREGKPVKLPKEIAAPRVREPLPIGAMGRKFGVACAVLACCGLAFLVFRPVLLKSGFFRWVDKGYTAWQLRNGIPGLEGVDTAQTGD